MCVCLQSQPDQTVETLRVISTPTTAPGGGLALRKRRSNKPALSEQTKPFTLSRCESSANKSSSTCLSFSYGAFADLQTLIEVYSFDVRPAGLVEGGEGSILKTPLGLFDKAACGGWSKQQT